MIDFLPYSIFSVSASNQEFLVYLLLELSGDLLLGHFWNGTPRKISNIFSSGQMN